MTVAKENLLRRVLGLLMWWPIWGFAQNPPPAELWDLERLAMAPAAEWGARDGLIQEVFYAGEPYQGAATRVFAYVGRPEGAGDGPYPGVVLVHGGGGTAFKDWADHWAKRGYVAIAMDTAGHGPGRVKLSDGGPGQGDDIKFREFADDDLREMWTYHAVADVILGHSLLRSLPEVDAERTALTGISWGGYLTCIVSGVDHRFKASVPVYGCGFLQDNSVWLDRGWFARLSSEAGRRWIRYFDPGQHVGRARFPMLFLNGTNDFAYPLDSYRKTIEQVNPYLTTVALRHELPHGHIWTFPVVDRFIDAALTEGKALARLGEIRYVGGKASAKILSGARIVSAELCYTEDRGPWQKRRWFKRSAVVHEGHVSASLSDFEEATFFLEAVDEHGMRTSTSHGDWMGSADGSTEGLPSPRLEEDFYDWYRRHAEVLRIKDEVDPEIVLIGDSITHLWGGRPREPRAKGEASWQALFGKRALNLGFGWDRTQNVIWRIDHGELDGIDPDWVVLLIGTNNLVSTAHYEAGSPDDIAQGVEAVGRRIRGKLPDAQLVLMALLPRGEQPTHPHRRAVEAVNARLPRVAKALGATWVDMGKAFLTDDGILPEELAPDFLHPSAAGYAIWAEALRSVVPAMEDVRDEPDGPADSRN